MSEQSENAGRGPVIARAGKRKWGYDVEQVDQFLARAHELYDSVEPKLTQRDIQRASFDLVKNGYVIAQVDAALSRLERAVVDKHTTWELEHNGRIPFRAQSEAMLASLETHYRREAKRRFKDGLGKKPSYDRKQVDRLVDQIIAKVSDELGVEGAQPLDSKQLSDITAARVANVVFTQRAGKRGYDERAVDYYLDVAVQLLSRLESYARVKDYASEPSGSMPVKAAAPAASAGPRTEVIAPLFPGDDAGTTGPAVSASSAPIASAANDFSKLTAEEHSIFKPAPAAAKVSAVPPAPSASPAPAAPAVPPVPSASPASSAPVVAPAASGSLAALAKSVGRHSQEPSVESAPTEAVPPVAVASEAPLPPAASSAVSSVVPPAASRVVLAEPVAPVAAPATSAAPEPVPAREAAAPIERPAATAPAANVAFPIGAESQTASAKDDGDADQYLTNLLSNTSFPKVDLDIPDLTFPSLNDNGNDVNQPKADTPDVNGDQQGR